MCDVENFAEDRDEMLKKASIDELKKFMNKYRDMFEEKDFEEFENTSDGVLEVILHKMIVNVHTLPKKLKEESKTWLISRGFSLEM